MPLRFYDNNDWRTPSEVRVRDNGNWNNVEIGYVYDLGVWKVVFPDAITPSISLEFGPWVTKNSVEIELNLINSDYIIVELFSGTNQSNLIQSKNIDTNENITDNESIIFQNLNSNTTYNIKVTAYSVTGHTDVLLTGSFITNPSITLTATAFSDLSGASVSWTTSRQSRWRVIIYRTSDGTSPYRSSLDLEFGTTNSINAYFSALANTQYTVQLDIEYTGGGTATEYVNFTTPNVIQPTINSLNASSTCNSATASWSGTNYVTAYVSLWSAFFDPGGNQWEKSGLDPLIGPITYNTSTTSHLFTGLTTQEVYIIDLVLVSSTGQSVDYRTQFGEEKIVVTADPSVNSPTNFSASSDYHGKVASFSWTAATANCANISGYRIEYKLSTSSTWLTLSDSISANATTFSAGGPGSSTFLSGRTYNFRIYGKSNSYISPPSSTITLTMNNNPYTIAISGTSTITTFSSSTLTAQLKNAEYENISASGFTISWSFIGGLNPPSGSSISPASSVTNSSGQATATFTSGSDDGTGTVYATTPNLGPLEGGQITMTVILSPARVPLLSRTNNIYGYDVSHSNYDSSWSYSSTVDSPGFIWSGSVSSTAFGVYIPTRNNTAPSASQDANYVYCTTGSWSPAPSISTTVTSSRTGYNNGSGSVTGSPTNVYTVVYQYDWYYYDANNVEQYWGAGDAANNGRRAKGTIYNNSIKGRLLYCRVTASRNHSGTITGGNSANSNKITGS